MAMARREAMVDCPTGRRQQVSCDVRVKTLTLLSDIPTPSSQSTIMC